MSDADQRAHFASEGYAVFERALEGPMPDLLREECAAVAECENARLDGISHRGGTQVTSNYGRTALQPACRSATRLRPAAGA